MVMASTQVARAAAQLHEAAQDVARVAASRSAQPEDMTMNGRSTGSQHVDRHPRLATSQTVPGHHRLPTVTMVDAARFAPFAARWPLRTFLELGALPGAVPCARLHARNVLAEWGLAVFSESTGLLVSELVTNAIQISRMAARRRRGRRKWPGTAYRLCRQREVGLGLSARHGREGRLGRS
jgi:hypothetical protein